MSDALRLVGLLFVRSIPTIIFVVILVAILDRLFFRPIAAVLKQRAGETTGALERARRQAEEAAAKTEHYRGELAAARAEIFRKRQEDHQSALAEMDGVLRRAREHSEGLVHEASQALAAEVAEARRELTASTQSLAREIAGKILAAPEGGEDRAA